MLFGSRGVILSRMSSPPSAQAPTAAERRLFVGSFIAMPIYFYKHVLPLRDDTS